jgi:hypothetical protein
VLCVHGIGRRLTDSDESWRPAGRRKKAAAAGGVLGFRGGGKYARVKRVRGKRGKRPGWRRPAATLAQPVADGVTTPPRLANGRGRFAETAGWGTNDWARVSEK